MKTFLIAAFVLFSASAFGQMTTDDFCNGKYKKYYIFNPNVKNYKPNTGHRYSYRSLYITINNGSVEVKYVDDMNTYCLGQMTKTVKENEEQYTFDDGTSILIMTYRDGSLYFVTYVTKNVTAFARYTYIE